MSQRHTPPTSRHRNATRLLIATATVAVAVLLPAGAASARGGGWEPWQAPTGITGYCGNTLVHVTFPTNKEFVRELPLQPGTTDIQEFTGMLYVRYTTDAGASVLVNAGGPGVVTTYANGDVETRSRGHYNFGLTPEQAAELGVPQVFTTTGLLDYITHTDGTLTPIRIPHDVTDECAALGL
jgi:hypothetical protein